MPRNPRPPLLALLLPLLAAAPAGAEPTPPRTLAVVEATVVRDGPDGHPLSHWAPGTLFTSNQARAGWIRATGHFPDGRWAPTDQALWVPEAAVQERGKAQQDAEVDSRPRTYRLPSAAAPRNGRHGSAADEPWPEGTRFTSNHREDGRVRVTGHFPEGGWSPMTAERWFPLSEVEDISPPPNIPRPPGSERWIRIVKSSFHLEVHQRDAAGREEKLYRTRVGLGMDRCLPEEEGGRCYFTEPGEYAIRWKIHDPDGIEWCIPESMEQQERYREHIAAGRRCFPAALGHFALNIGGPYAIHGTQNPGASLGRQVTHGCVRVQNDEMEKVWRYMEEGDRVVIVDDA